MAYQNELKGMLKEILTQLVVTTERLEGLYDFLTTGSGKQQFLSEECTCPNNAFIWKFTDFQRRLKQAKGGKNTKLFSEPFHICASM